MLFGSVILQAGDITFYVDLAIVILALIIALAIVAASLKIIREYERVVQFQFGRLKGSKGPGIIIIFTAINSLVKVDLRERYKEDPQHTAITMSNAPADTACLIYYKVIEASASLG